MANVNTVTTYTSTSTLTTAVVTDFFSDNNTRNMDQLKSVCLVSMAAETGFQSTTAKTMSIPLFSASSATFVPTKYIVELATVGSFPAGTDKAAASLSWQLATAATPTTLALGGSTGSGFTPVISTTLINAAVAASSTAVGQNTLITAGGSVGTSVPTTVDQSYQGQVVNTSTNPTVVLPGKTLYLNITTGGTLTSSTDLTVTGAWRIYVFGNTRVSP